MTGRGTARIIHGDALDLPLDDATVDLVVTSPPFWALRSYTDGGEHYEGQVGDEANPAEYVDALIAATREMVRVLKPTGSIWVNLGDKYSQRQGQYGRGHEGGGIQASKSMYHRDAGRTGDGYDYGVPAKSLVMLPWRYAIRCVDELGLLLRAEVIWHKTSSMPEPVTDRVRRSHETWLHFVKEPKYYAAVDEIREEAVTAGQTPAERRAEDPDGYRLSNRGGQWKTGYVRGDLKTFAAHPMGRLPGSVWTVPTQSGMRVPEELGIKHYAGFPVEWPRKIILGWSPSGICTVCGEGLRPVAHTEVDTSRTPARRNTFLPQVTVAGNGSNGQGSALWGQWTNRYITGYECGCDVPSASTVPAVVLDPFGGSGTTALVAKALGRDGVSVDLSKDYCRLAEWRVNDEGELAAAVGLERPKKQVGGQLSMFGNE